MCFIQFSSDWYNNGEDLNDSVIRVILGFNSFIQSFSERLSMFKIKK